LGFSKSIPATAAAVGGAPAAVGGAPAAVGGAPAAAGASDAPPYIIDGFVSILIIMLYFKT